jgi:signal transduction histidine kinase
MFKLFGKFQQFFIQYFAKENRMALTADQKISERYFLNFNFICIATLAFFTVTNCFAAFWEAFWIDVAGLISFYICVSLYKKTDNYNLPVGLLILTCSFVLFAQHAILEPDAYHNAYFFPAISVFSFALLNKKALLRFYLFSIAATAILAHFVVRHYNTTIKILTPAEKDMYVYLTVIASIYATFKIVEVLGEQRQTAYDQLGASNERNKQLLAMVTHDIANPLSVMSTSIYMLKKKSGNLSEIQTYIDRFEKAEKSIVELIESSRKMLAVEDGKFSVEIESVDIKKILKEVVDNFSYKCDAKNIQCELQMPMEDLFVLADPGALRTSIVSNILSNAIKFSNHNSKINIRLINDGTNVKVEIQDSGIGMPSELVAKVFMAHAKTTRSGTEGEKGTGYGMPLAKAYIEIMGGHIQCHSEQNVGTTFCFTLKKA